MVRRFASFVLGAALVAVTGLGIVLATQGFGLLRLTAFGLAGVVALLSLLWMDPSRIDGPGFRAGAASTGLAALGADILGGEPGLGFAQLAVAGVAIVVVVAGPRILQVLGRPLPAWTAWVGLALVGSVLVATVIGGGSLGHDESAYALKARSWLEGTDDGGWTIHRAVVPSLVAAAVLPFSDSDAVLRMVSVVFSLLTVVAVGWFGKTVHSRRVGLMAAGLFAIAPSFLRRGAEFLTDIPATGMLLVVAVLLWKWLTERGSDRLLLVAAAVGAVAVYTRYQAAVTLLLLAVAGVVLFWTRVKAAGAALLRAAGLGLLLLVPHFIYATATTGTPWGIFTITGEIAGREYLGQGLVDYARAFPNLLAGQLGAVAIVVAIGWGVYRLRASLRDRRLDSVDRATFFCLIPALGQFVFLGIVSHGEPRFMFFPVALMLVVAGIAAEAFRKRASVETYRMAFNLLAGAIVVFLFMSGTSVDRNAEARGEATVVLQGVASSVVDNSEGECGIVTTYSPQLNWLSGCRVLELRRDRLVDLHPADVDWHLVLFEKGKRQPEGDLLDAYLEMAVGEPIPIDDPVDGIGDATIWRLAPRE
jgi:4-amino-4-deoxy-L-arabinose transferase-like glycosyltransferase